MPRMRRTWLAALAIVLCGATWHPSRDMVTLKVGIYTPDPAMAANAVGIGAAIDADPLIAVGEQRRLILPMDGYPKGVRVTITATAVK